MLSKAEIGEPSESGNIGAVYDRRIMILDS